MSACDVQRFEILPGQRGIWHALQVVPDNSVFNIGECLRIDGGLDTGLFEAGRWTRQPCPPLMTKPGRRGLGGTR
jgi:hypothetical protein